jgi:hypothetical protein
VLAVCLNERNLKRFYKKVLTTINLIVSFDAKAMQPKQQYSSGKIDQNKTKLDKIICNCLHCDQ